MPPRKSVRSGSKDAVVAKAQPTKGKAVAAGLPADVPDDKLNEKKEIEEEDEEHSAEETATSKNVRRSLRAPRSAQDTPATGTKASRVTRSRTRKSGNESPEESPSADEDDDDSEPVAPKKRGARRGARSSPAKKRGRRPSGRRGSASPKKKGRAAKRPRKRETDDEESEESELDLGESEEEERDEELDDDDDFEHPKSKPLPPAVPGSRRSSRNAATGSRVASVVLERMEGSSSLSRPTRSARGGRHTQKKKDEAEGADEVEEVEEEVKPSRKRARGRAAAAEKQLPRRGASRGRTRVTKAGKEADEDEEEEDDDDLLENVEGEAGASEKNKKKGKKRQAKKESKDEAAKSGGDDDIPSDKEEDDAERDDDDAKMEVDSEPTAENKKEAKSGKRKLPESGEPYLPPGKKAKIQEADSKESKADEEESSSDDSVKNVEGGKGSAEELSVKAVNGAEEAARPTDVEPKVNGEEEVEEKGASEIVSASIGAKVSRRVVVSSSSSKATSEPVHGFSLVSYNLGSGEWATRHDDLLEEVSILAPSILCLQGVDEAYFKSSLDSALKSDGFMGLYKAGKKATEQEDEPAGSNKQHEPTGLATFYLLSNFEIVHHAEFETRELLAKVVEASSLSDAEKEVAKGLLGRITAPVLLTKLRAVPSGKCVTVANVELPLGPSFRVDEDLDESMLALQAAAVLREVLDLSDASAGESHVLCGTLGRLDGGSVVRQLLENGRLNDDTLESLKKKAASTVQTSGDEQKRLSLVSLLENSFRHALPNLRSSYESVLGHELKCPGDKSPKDTVWISADSLQTKSVLDLAFPSTTAADIHISLKADLSFVH